MVKDPQGTTSGGRDSAAAAPGPGLRTGRVTRILFGAFLVMALTVPSLTDGLLNWLPVVRFPGLADPALGVGPLALLPLLAVGSWIVHRSASRDQAAWRWGPPGVAIPLAGFTLLTLLGLDMTISHRTVVVLLMLLVLWWVYLFVVNEAPSLVAPLSIVLSVQGSIALAQFANQGDLGLQWLGEPVLDPARSGTTVLFARGQRWLRAYGLSGHPNPGSTIGNVHMSGVVLQLTGGFQ